LAPGPRTHPLRREGAGRTGLGGNANEQIPKVMAAMRTPLENLQHMTAEDSALNTSLGGLQSVTERMRGPHGALAGLLGSEGKVAGRQPVLFGELAGVAHGMDEVIGGTDILHGGAERVTVHHIALDDFGALADPRLDVFRPTGKAAQRAAAPLKRGDEPAADIAGDARKQHPCGSSFVH